MSASNGLTPDLRATLNAHRARLGLAPVHDATEPRPRLPYASFADRQTAMTRAWDATGNASDRSWARLTTMIVREHALDAGRVTYLPTVGRPRT